MNRVAGLEGASTEPGELPGPRTVRGRVLGQLVVCEGCCCGQASKGHAPVPSTELKREWKERKLARAIHLTVSGCLGPCDVANVCAIVSRDGVTWIGGIKSAEPYRLLMDWAEASRAAGWLLPLPEALEGHRFARFDVVSILPDEPS